MQNLKIKSEVFHSFLSLIYNTEPIIINIDVDNDSKLSNELILMDNFNNIPAIITINNLTELTILKETSHFRYCDSKLPVIRYNNLYALNMIILNNLTEETLNTIIDWVKGYTDGLELFKIASEKSDKHTKDIIQAKIDANKENVDNLETLLNNTIVTTLQAKIDEKYREYKDCLANAELYYNQYQKLLEEQCYKIQQKSSIFADLINICNRNRLIKITTIKQQSIIKIYTLPLRVEYTCGEEAARRIIFSNREFENTSTEIKDMLFDALTDRTNYTLLHDPIVIHIELSGTSIYQWYINHYHYERSTYGCWTSEATSESNVHYFRYKCFGGFAADFSKAKSTNDIPCLISNILQYISTINIADGAGLAWATSRIHIIEDKTTNKIYRVDKSTNIITDITENYNRLINLNYKQIKAQTARYKECYITNEDKL